MKRKRQIKIMELITDNIIETQEDLATRLSDAGFEITQATVSRDIKEMGLVKVAVKDGKYRYSNRNQDDQNRISYKYLTILQESVIKTDFAQNITVIKTYAGMAQAAAAAIDSMNIREIVGTIAGDDTIMLVMRDSESAEEFAGRIEKIME